MPISCIKYLQKPILRFWVRGNKVYRDICHTFSKVCQMLELNPIYHCCYKHVRLLEWQSGPDLLVSYAKKILHGQYLPMAANLKMWQIIRFNLYQHSVVERFITLCLLRTYMCILVSCTEYQICIVQNTFLNVHLNHANALCCSSRTLCGLGEVEWS